LLAKLASSDKGGRQKTMIQETLKTPQTTTDNMAEVQQVSTSEGIRRSHRSLTQETVKTPRISRYPVAGAVAPQIYQVESGETWMIAYQRYLADGVLPLEPAKAQKMKKNLIKYTLIDGKLFRHGFTHPILVCVDGEQCTRIMAELHEGICGSHIGGRSLSSKAIHAGYYWPTTREDCTRYAQRCKQCQQHADWHKVPPEELRSIYNSWPFHTWGIDILGPFPLAVRQMKYLVVSIEYFTKWIEAEPVAQIATHKIQHFVWKNIVCRFKIPKRLVSNNGTQFASSQLGKLCIELGVKQVFTSVEHPRRTNRSSQPIEFCSKV